MSLYLVQLAAKFTSWALVFRSSLLLDATAVRLDGLDAEVERIRHLPGRQALADHPQDLQLPVRQPLDRALETGAFPRAELPARRASMASLT